MTYAGAAAAGALVIFLLSVLGGRFVSSSQIPWPVTDLHVQVNSPSSCRYYSCTWADLKCARDDNLHYTPTYVWYKNGEVVPDVTSSIYSEYFYPEDSYSCAAVGHEYRPSPPVCVAGSSCNRVIYSSRSLCATVGSTVDISCTYRSYDDDIQSKFWFIPDRNYYSQPGDLTNDYDYAGRAQVFDSTNRGSTLRITNLVTGDSNEYRFKFKTASFEWKSVSPGTRLRVTDLQVQVTSKTVTHSYAEAKLKCINNCYRPTIVWFKNGQKIKVGSSTYSAYFYPGDVITCAVKGHESHRSPSVYTPNVPSVWVRPSREVTEGTSLTLSCSSGANPTATYSWYRNNVNQYNAFLRSGSQLELWSIQPSQSGHYYCIAENALGRRTSESIFINVKYAPKTSSVSMNPTGEIVEGCSVTLTCNSDANPAPTYTWYKEDRQLLQGSGSYRFTSITAENRGAYYCKSENQYGRRMSSSLFVDVKYAPKLPFVSINSSGEIMEGSSVTLNCISDANPAANYTWYKENQTLINGSEGIYHFTSISSEDRGIYYCKSGNQYGKIMSSPLFIDVQYPPRLPSVSLNPFGKIVEGSSVSLNCSSDANPAANYTWYKENQTLINGSKDARKLPFASVNSSDEIMEGRSMALNCSSDANPAANYTWYKKNQTLINGSKDAPKLPFASMNSSYEIMEGSSVTLSCSSDANPAANYTWYKENQTLINGSEGIYHFTPIRSEDRGIYYCKSENQYGRIMSSPLFINVQYPPKPQFASVNSSGEIVEGSSVTLNCSSDANPAANYILDFDRSVFQFLFVSGGFSTSVSYSGGGMHGQLG
ncbi:B-cell receptor CD22-like [Mugil cephalus]|uniref:B-cell receptor CD22-like n=1 Tax=Mugil cephalus TaxID=48193 RepID=UPI001FB646FC|nr:B-cell receptor CD22-like [Mugil cephalus]